MKILLVSSYLPYPLFSGGSIRLYNLIKEISRNHKITLICEKREFQTEEDKKELNKYCEQVITVPRRKQWTLQNILKTGFSRYPFLLVGHSNIEMKQSIVKQLNEKHFDVIHVETFYVFQNIPKTYLPIVLVEHNIEYLVYKRYANQSKLVLRPLLLFDVLKIKYWEEKFWQKATKLVAVSDREKEIMKRQDTIVVPNGVNTDLYKLKSLSSKFNKKERKVLFIGDFNWIQNRNSLENILRNIWPIIEEKSKGTDLKLKLWVVGKNIPENLKALGTKSVIFDNDAPSETWKIYHQSDVLLSPITVGGGTSYKILESMATGLPVISTRLGIEGLGAIEGKEVLTGTSGDELADQVMNILKDKTLYEKISLNARSLIEKKFTWKVISKTLEDVYKSALKT